MAGDNDFFLKFGSNAESFADEVERSVSSAEVSLGRLTTAVQNLNRGLRDSPLRDVTSTIQDEMRGIARTVSQTLAKELSAHLKRELPNIAKGITLQLDADVTPRSNATSTDEGTRRSAAADRASARATERANRETEKQAKDIAQAAEIMERVLRAAHDDIEIGADQLALALRNASKEIRDQVLAQVKNIRNVQTQGEAATAKAKAGDPEARMAVGELMRDLTGLKDSVLRLTNALLSETTPATPGEARESQQVEFDETTMVRMTQAAIVQRDAAATMKAASESFNAAVDQLSASIRNIPQAIADAERAMPRDVIKEQAIVEAEAEKVVKPATADADTVVADMRNALTRMSQAMAEAGGMKEALEREDFQTARADLRGLAGDDALVGRAMGSLVNTGGDVDEAMRDLEKAVRTRVQVEQRLTAVAEKSAAETTEDTNATQDVTAAKNREAEAREAAARAASEAAIRQKEIDAKANRRLQQRLAGGVPEAGTLDATDLNEPARREARRAGVRPTREVLEKLAQSFVGSDVDDVAQFVEQTQDQVAAARKTLKDLGQSARGAFDMPELQTHGLFGVTEQGAVTLGGLAIEPPRSGRQRAAFQTPGADAQAILEEQYRAMGEAGGINKAITDARRVLDFDKLQKQVLGAQMALSTVMEFPEASIEALATKSKDPFQREVVQAARQSLELIDREIIQRYDDLKQMRDKHGFLPEKQQAMFEALEPMDYGARMRVSQREADERAMQARIETLARTGEGELGRLAGGDGRLQTGGLAAFSKLIEGPKGERFFLNELGDTQMKNTFDRLGGATKENIAIVEQYNATVRELISANRDLLMRKAAQQTLADQERLGREGFPVDEAQVQRAQRVMDRTEGIDDYVKVLRDSLISVPEGELGRLQDQRSLFEIVRGRAPQVGDVTDLESDRAMQEALERRNVRARLAEQRGVDLGAATEGITTTGIEGRLERIRAEEAALGTAGVSADELSEEYARASQSLRKAWAAEERHASAIDRYLAVLGGFEAALRAPGDKAGAFGQSLLGGGFTEADQRLRQARTQGLDEVALRRMATLGTEPVIGRQRPAPSRSDIDHVITALGGPEALLDRMVGAARPAPTRRDVPVRDLADIQAELTAQGFKQKGFLSEQDARELPAAGFSAEDIFRYTQDQKLGGLEGDARRNVANRIAESFEHSATAAERMFQTQQEAVAAENQRFASAQRTAEVLEEERLARRGRLESGLAGTDPEARGEIDQFLRTFAQRELESIQQAERQRAAAIDNAVRAAGEDPRRFAGMEPDEIVARLGGLEQSVEENTVAERDNTAATKAETAGDRGGDRPTMPISDDSQERFREAQRLLALGEPARTGAQKGKTLFDRAREFSEQKFDELPSGQKSQLSRVRNQLVELAGGADAVYDNLIRQGFSDPKARQISTGKDITAPLIAMAEAGRLSTLDALQRTDLTGGIAAEAQDQVNAKLISVLTNLEGTMSRLIECCARMKGAVDGAAGGIPEEARVRASGEELRARVSGELSESMANAVGRAVRAQAAGDEEGFRRGMTEAAMEVMADPNMGQSLSRAEIKQMVGAFYQEATGAAPTKEAMVGVDSSLIDAGRWRGVSPGAFAAFKAGDMENAARAAVKSGKSVDETMDLLARTSDLTSDRLSQLRVGLEAYEQQLIQTAAATQQATTAETRRRAETPSDQLMREMQGRAYAPGVYDPDRPPAANALAVGRARVEAGDDPLAVMRMLGTEGGKGLFPDLTDDNRRLIASELERAAALQRSQQELAEATALEQRRNAILDLLPRDLRQQVQAGQAGGAEITQYLDAQNMNRNPASATTRRTIDQLFQPDGANIRQSALDTVDRYTETAAHAMQQFQTPMQRLIAGALGGRGSIVENVIRTTGNFISRYIGGAIVFGLAAQVRELTSVALETEQTFIRISSALDATARSSDGLKSALQDVAIETNTNINDTYEVMAQLVGVFESTDEALEATRVIGQLELISQGALNAREGFRALSAVVAAFQETLVEERGMSQVGAITYVADLATRIQDLTGVNIEDTTEGLARLGETANALNIEMELIAAAIGLTAKASGQTGSAASEQIGRILAQFQSSQAQNLLIRLGITDAETVRAGNFNQVMRDLFENYNSLDKAQQRTVANVLGDPRQFALTNALLSNGAEALEVYEGSLNNAGAAAERADDVLGTLRGQIGQVGKTIQAVITNLIDLGVLNIFGVALTVAGQFLKIVNEILQVFVGIKESSPLADFVIDLGFAIAGFKLLAGLISGAVAESARLAGIQGVDSTRGAMAYGAEILGGRRRRRRGGVDADLTPEMASAQRARAAAEGTAVAQQARRARLIDRSPILREARWQIDQSGVATRARMAAQSVSQFGSRMSGLAGTLRRAAPAALAGAFAFGLLFDAVTKGSREVMEYYGNLNAQKPRKPGETPEEATEREMREEMDRKAAELGGAKGIRGTLENMGTVLDIATSSGEGFARAGSVILGALNPLSYLDPRKGKTLRTGQQDQFGAELAGELKPESQQELDNYFNTMRMLRDNVENDADALAGAKELRDSLIAEADRIVEEQDTPAGRANAQKQVDGLRKFADALVGNVDARLTGLAGLDAYTTSQIDSLTAGVQFLSGLSLNAQRQYASAIALLLDPERVDLTPEAQGALQAISGAANTEQRLRAQADASQILVREAERDFRNAVPGTPEADQAKARLEQLVQLAFQTEQELISFLVEGPQAAAELAERLGDYSGAESELRRMLQGIREQKAKADPGSREEAAAIQAEMDALKQIAEMGIAEQVGALEIAAAGTRNPLEGLGAELEIAQTRLEAAQSAGEGAYTPEEIRAMTIEVMRLQQQIADEEESIAQAYADVARARMRDPLQQAHHDHAEALRRYQRAIDLNMGAAEIATAEAAVIEAKHAIADQLNAEAAAYSSILAARTLDPLRDAHIAYRDALREYRHAVSQGLGDAAVDEAYAEVIETQHAIEEQNESIRQAEASLASAGTRNALEQASLGLAEAWRVYNRAIALNLGREAILSAREGVIQAEQEMRDTEESLRAARAELSIAQLPDGDVMAIASAQLAEAMRAQARAAREFGENSEEYINATIAVINAQEEVENVITQIADAQASLAIALANAAGLSTRSATLSLENAQRKLREAIANAGGNMDAPEVIAAQEEVVNASAAVRDTMFDDAIGTINFNRDMEYITAETAMAQLQQLLENANLTEEQRRQVLGQMKSLQDEINSQFEGQFNLGDIRIPTPFEIRRALGMEAVQDHVQHLIEDTVGFFGGDELPTALREAISSGTVFDPDQYRDDMYRDPDLNIPGVVIPAAPGASPTDLQMGSSLNSVAENTAGMRGGIDAMVAMMEAFMAESREVVVQFNGADLMEVKQMMDGLLGNRTVARRTPSGPRKY